VQLAKRSRAHNSGGGIFCTKHATCQKVKQNIVLVNHDVMDFVGGEDLKGQSKSRQDASGMQPKHQILKAGEKGMS
jgi:hypothetical protein